MTVQSSEHKGAKKETFCAAGFWHSLHTEMNHLFQQVQDLTLLRLAGRVGGDNGFVLLPVAEVTFFIFRG